jgi:hypothetical protein
MLSSDRSRESYSDLSKHMGGPNYSGSSGVSGITSNALSAMPIMP